MALIQVSEILQFTHIYIYTVYLYICIDDRYTIRWMYHDNMLAVALETPKHGISPQDSGFSLTATDGSYWHSLVVDVVG